MLVTETGVEVLTLGAREALQIEAPSAPPQRDMLLAGSSGNWF